MSANDNAWVVVSGAGGAIGSAAVVHYAAQGRRVLALDRQFDSVRKPSDRVIFQSADLLVEEQVRQALAASVDAADRIALLVNAVGLIWNEPLLAFRGGKFSTHNFETWRRVTDANLTAPFVAATQVGAHMARRGGGCIVNFSSIAGQGNAGQAAYSAAKAGIEGLTRTMAIELAPFGVRVNAVALGFIDVATTREGVSDDQLRQYAAKTPLGRLGRVDEVLGAVDFLFSNTFVNGAIVKIDGGLRL